MIRFTSLGRTHLFLFRYYKLPNNWNFHWRQKSLPEGWTSFLAVDLVSLYWFLLQKLSPHRCKTDRSKTHRLCRLCLDLLAVRMAFVRKRCGGKFGWSVLVNSSPKLIFGTLIYYVKYSRRPSQLTCCAPRSTSRYSTLGLPTVTTPSRPRRRQQHGTVW